MTKDIVVICAGMLAVGVGVWTFWGNTAEYEACEDRSGAHLSR